MEDSVSSPETTNGEAGKGGRTRNNWSNAREDDAATDNREALEEQNVTD